MNEIRTERLTLKPMCMDYLESTHEYASDPENTTFMLWLPNDSIEETKEYIEGAEKEFLKDYYFRLLKPGKTNSALFKKLIPEQYMGADLYSTDIAGYFETMAGFIRQA